MSFRSESDSDCWMRLRIARLYFRDKETLK